MAVTFTSPLEGKAILRRRYAPKNKGGCTTCRCRHVRCDQTRPRCASCKKSRRQCRYPGPNSPLLSTSNTITTSLNPGAKSAIKVVFYSPPTTHSDITARLPRGPAAHPDHSPAENRALRYFRDIVAERLAGYFDARFWNTVVVRVCHSPGQNMRSLRHAVVALASHWENVVVPKMGRRSTPDWECDDFTLKQYTLAITELRCSMEAESKPSTVELLLSSLLFICLEMFQNHYESALRQLSSGLYLFSEWQSKRRKSPTSADHKPIGSPGNDNEDELETHLTHIFKRLLTQSLLFPVRRLDTRLLIPSLTPNLPSMPSKFTTPDEARDSFNDCISSILHGVRSRSCMNPPACATGSSFLKQWSFAFAEFRAREEPKLTEVERRNCIILEMQRLAMYLYALSSSFKSEMEFDEWMPEFARLVELGRYIVETKRLTVPQGKILHYPKFDIGLIAPLYLVASRCRDSDLRREAVWVLRNGPRQEGVWNSAILASIAERIIEIEEAGIEVDRFADVKVEKRVSLEDAAILTTEKKVAAVFLRGKQDGTKGEVLYEMIPYLG